MFLCTLSRVQSQTCSNSRRTFFSSLSLPNVLGFLFKAVCLLLFFLCAWRPGQLESWPSLLLTLLIAALCHMNGAIDKGDCRSQQMSLAVDDAIVHSTFLPLSLLLLQSVSPGKLGTSLSEQRSLTLASSGNVNDSPRSRETLFHIRSSFTSFHHTNLTFFQCDSFSPTPHEYMFFHFSTFTLSFFLFTLPFFHVYHFAFSHHIRSV